MLKCKDGSLYTGITNNLERRIEEHKKGKGGYYTKSFGVFECVYNEIYPTKKEALKREAQIKGRTRKKKFALIYHDDVLLKKL